MEYIGHLNKLPMLRLLIPFITGIIIQCNIRAPFHLIFIFIATGFTILCAICMRPGNPVYGPGRTYGFFLSLFILGISMGLTERRMSASSFMDISGNGGFIIAGVIDKQERDHTFRLLIRPVAFISGGSLIKTSGRAIAWLEKDSISAGLVTGHHIVIPNNFREISNAGNPFEFDYRRYMMIQNIAGETYVPAGSWFHTEGGKYSARILYLPGRIRNHLLGVLENNGISGRELSVASALILGYRSGLDHETRDNYAGSGAMHILAVSGLHVGILYVLLVWLTGFLKRVRYLSPVIPAIILIVIWFYAFLTGLSPSVTRAAIMFSFLAAARFWNRPAEILNTVSSSAILQLIADPLALFMAGFQLSYLAVAGIIIFQPVIYSAIRLKNYIADRIWALVSLSFSAQILIFPLIIYYFNHFPIYFPVTNVFAVPLAMLILYSGLSLFLFSFIPFLAAIPSFILNLALVSLNFITASISNLPYARISDIMISFPMAVVLYGIILAAIMFIVFRKARFLHYLMLLIISALAFRADLRLRDSRNLFIVYNVRGESVYNFISGHSSVVVLPENSLDTVSIPYVATAPARHLNASEVNVTSRETFFRTMGLGNFVLFAGKCIYFPHDNDIKNAAKPLHADLMIISSHTADDLDNLLNMVIPKLVVIDSSVAYYRRSVIAGLCRKKGIECHDVGASGAFFAEMDKYSPGTP
jgi:competence protein ComEC